MTRDTSADRPALFHIYRAATALLAPFAFRKVAGKLAEHGVSPERQRERLGYATSVRYSPILEETIGLGLVKPNADFRPGGVVTLLLDGKEIQADFVDHAFYDPQGERMKS